MRAVVVNCSTPHYNLGARKCATWLKEHGHDVAYYDSDPGIWELDADIVCLSVIFSWHAPIACQIALRMKAHADVWAGGPGLFALANWWRKETGLEIVKGLDERFERQRGHYKMAFASRGCSVNCAWCIVPRLEGLAFTFDPDFQPAPILCDNNLSALPVQYQEHIIRRYQETGARLLDASSGFEPHFFDVQTYERWKPIIRGGPWRFALDEMRELEDVRRMMLILKNVAKSRKRVYCLVGNESIRQCYERACKIIEWGGEPFCQFVLPLNWLGDPDKVKLRYDWRSYQQGRDFCRYYNRFGWRTYLIWEYNNRKSEQPPFAQLKPVQAVY
jgi:hypothetical protein